MFVNFSRGESNFIQIPRIHDRVVRQIFPLMAINFCCNQLKTKIHSQAVSCEGYDLSNLLSRDPIHREKGFLAEGFTKPPISIFLQFFCNVNISHILIWTEVGRQKSNGLELLINPVSVAVEGESNNKTLQVSREGSSVKIGSCRLKNETGLMLRKYRYRVEPVVPSNFLVKNFYTSSRVAIENAGSLEIKIYSTANSSVPALKKIEIWGNPSRNCSKEVKKLIFDTWSQVNSLVELKLTDGKPAEIKVKPNEEPKSSLTDNDGLIPDEFVDPITCDIMAIPMALPCGKVVDLSTLEKFNGIESSWGRGPSDPFSGIPFTKSTFAIPDTALKSRIDQFLVENGHLKQLRGVGRTVGQNTKNHSLVMKICGKVEPTCKHFSNHCSSSSISSGSFNVSAEIRNELPLTISHTQSTSSDVQKGSTNSEDVYVDGVIDRSFGMKRKNFEQATTISKKSKIPMGVVSVRNHEEILEDTLNFAIGSVLTGLPSFLKISAESIESKDMNDRTDCNKCHSMQCLFSLPCEHLLCRNCLVISTGKTEPMKCVTCNSSFTTGDVKRFHNL